MSGPTNRASVHPSLRYCAALIPLALAATALADPPRLQSYQTRYYTLHTDLDAAGAREATLRITLMAEEFHRRTKGFATNVRHRLPFCLFRNAADYHAAGGPPGTAGVFTGDRLMATVHPQHPDATWHTVQHEGFHQFIVAAVGYGIPIWANEGLAEYFGTGLFTGDHFIVGLIPAGRAARVKALIQGGRMRSLADMMRLSHEAWNSSATMVDYDQAWSMVHFLVHGDDERYQAAFEQFLRKVSSGADWERAWVDTLGRNVAEFERRWKAYWLRLPANPTFDLYAEATASTITGFYARAFSQRQYFDDFNAFVAAAQAGKLKMDEDDWLPPALLVQAFELAPQVGKWRVEQRHGRRVIVCQTVTGATIEGGFEVRRGRVASVTIKRK
jgi:hypothetical protein